MPSPLLILVLLILVWIVSRPRQTAMSKLIIRETHRGALYEDGVFRGILNPGAYATTAGFWSSKRREIVLVDVRQRSLTIKGQEILTADKVAIGVSILVGYRVVDVRAALHEVESYESRIYEDVQLSTRRYLAARTLDEILRARNELSDAVRADVREVAAAYGIEIARADVKDLVFPGKLREIMNLVLETERTSEARLIEARKTAEASLIRARGEQETLAVRLEADRLLSEQLDRSPALLRLRELEAMQRIADKPGHHFYVGLGGGESRPTVPGPAASEHPRNTKAAPAPRVPHAVGFDAAALVEVSEHLDAGKFRHRDHRFEWTRAELQGWAEGVAGRFGYTVRFLPVGPEDAALGAPTQMGVFTRP